MAFNDDDQLPSYDEVMRKAREYLGAPPDIVSIEQTSSPQPTPVGVAESPSDELLALEQNYTAAKDKNLYKQDEATLALAQYYYEAGNHMKSFEYFMRLYDIRMDICGPYSVSETLSEVMHNLVTCLSSMGRYEASLKWTVEIMKIEENSKRSTFRLAQTYTDHAFALQQLGDFKGASNFYEKALTTENSRTSEDTIYKAHTLRNMGRLSRQTHEYHQALVYLNLSLTMYTNLCGSISHSNIINCLHEMGLTHFTLKQYTSSRKCYEEIVDRLKDLHRDEPFQPDIEMTTEELGNVCFTMSDFPAAEIYYREVVRIREVKYGIGSRHEKLLRAFRKLLLTLQAQQKETEARAIEIFL